MSESLLERKKEFFAPRQTETVSTTRKLLRKYKPWVGIEDDVSLDEKTGQIITVPANEYIREERYIVGQFAIPSDPESCLEYILEDGCKIYRFLFERFEIYKVYWLRDPDPELLIENSRIDYPYEERRVMVCPDCRTCVITPLENVPEVDPYSGDSCEIPELWKPPEEQIIEKDIFCENELKIITERFWQSIKPAIIEKTTMEKKEVKIAYVTFVFMLRRSTYQNEVLTKQEIKAVKPRMEKTIRYIINQ